MARTDDGLSRLRAWWFRRQGLTPASSPRTLADALRCAGWLVTAGSTNVYLSLRARMPGVSRDAVDRAAVDGIDVVEVPGAHARPPVLVPGDEMTLALALHAASFAKHVAPQFASGRYSEAAFTAVGAQACRALDEGPLSMAGIRAAVTHRDAGELLAGALIDLALRGVIRRYPADGRLDSSKYVYELRHPDDRPDLSAEGDAASVAARATGLFLRRHGPADVDEIADWASLTKGAVRKALTALQAEPYALDGWSGDGWVLPEQMAEWKTFAADDRHVAFLPHRDPFVSLRRSPAALARRGTAAVLNATLQPATIAEVSRLHHHVIVAGGELVGVWEYDPDAEGIVTRLWNTDTALRARVADAAAETGRFVRQQLGDASLSAIDPPERRAARLKFCRR